MVAAKIAQTNKVPFVSVLMSVYNGEQYLKETIKSVLDQSFQNFEFIVVENGSEDSSLDILKSFHDSRIKILQLEQNVGLSQALNHGLQHSSAELIARIDADDLMRKDRLEKQVDFMKKNPHIALLGSAVERIFSNGKHRDFMYFQTTHDDIIQSIAYGSPFAHPSVIFRKIAINELGNYNEKLSYAQDFKLWLEVLKKHQVSNLDIPLTLYRTHSSQNSLRAARESCILFKEILEDEHWSDKIDKKIATKTLRKWEKVPCQKTVSKLRLQKWKGWESKLPDFRKIVLYGGGDHTIRLLEELDLSECKTRPFLIVDRQPIGNELEQVPLTNSKKLPTVEFDYIIISSYFYEKEIYDELVKEYPAEKILRFYELES